MIFGNSPLGAAVMSVGGPPLTECQKQLLKALITGNPDGPIEILGLVVLAPGEFEVQYLRANGGNVIGQSFITGTIRY